MKPKLKQLIEQWKTPLAISSGITAMVIVLSFTGVFQILEWAIWDLFFRLRPVSKPDPRIVIVSIDESDISQIGRWPISDETLSKLLTKIKAQKPRVIGLDIFRNLPVPPGHEQLVRMMESTPNLIGIEKISGDAIPPPPTLAELDRVAGADVVIDADGKIRRGLLSIKPDHSQTKLSLGANLALIYLQQEHIILESLNSENNYYKLGKTIFKPFQRNQGVYVNADVGGYQILLNFRGKPCISSNSCAFEMISLTDVLNNNISPTEMQDKVVLIGVIASSLSNFFSNPYTYSDNTTVSGVEIHAHLTSQIISAAIEGNYLIRTLPKLGEWIWIFFWSSTGAILASKCLKNI